MNSKKKGLTELNSWESTEQRIIMLKEGQRKKRDVIAWEIGEEADERIWGELPRRNSTRKEG